jgi:hypothetical protein
VWLLLQHQLLSLGTLLLLLLLLLLVFMLRKFCTASRSCFLLSLLLFKLTPCLSLQLVAVSCDA